MGFVKMPNDLDDWEWFTDKNMLTVYVWLFMKAAWRDTRHKGVDLTRGQAAVTYPEISRCCDITPRQARTIVQRLKTEGRIAVTITPRFSIITVLDYDGCSENDSQNVSQMSAECQSNVSPTLLYKKDNNIKRQETRASRERPPEYADTGESSSARQENAPQQAPSPKADSGFEAFWAAYPKKIARQQAFEAWEKLAPDEELTAKILLSLERQKKSEQWTRDNGRYIPYSANWLTNMRWQDEIPRENESRGYSDRRGNSSYGTEDLKAKMLALYKNRS